MHNKPVTGWALVSIEYVRSREMHVYFQEVEQGRGFDKLACRTIEYPRGNFNTSRIRRGNPTKREFPIMFDKLDVYDMMRNHTHYAVLIKVSDSDSRPFIMGFGPRDQFDEARNGKVVREEAPAKVIESIYRIEIPQEEVSFTGTLSEITDQMIINRNGDPTAYLQTSFVKWFVKRGGEFFYLNNPPSLPERNSMYIASIIRNHNRKRA